MKYLRRILSDESGQGLAEYSLIISSITLVAVGAVILFGESVYDIYETIKEDVINAL